MECLYLLPPQEWTGDKASQDQEKSPKWQARCEDDCVYGNQSLLVSEDNTSSCPPPLPPWDPVCPLSCCRRLPPSPLPTHQSQARTIYLVLTPYSEGVLVRLSKPYSMCGPKLVLVEDGTCPAPSLPLSIPTPGNYVSTQNWCYAKIQDLKIRSHPPNTITLPPIPLPSLHWWQTWISRFSIIP